MTTSAVANPLPRLGSEIRNWSNRKTKIALDHLFLCSEFEKLMYKILAEINKDFCRNKLSWRKISKKSSVNFLGDTLYIFESGI